MFGKILAFIGAVLGIICVIAAFQPDDFRIERSATIAAPAVKVFAQVNDFHKWQAWSPWEKMDPAMKRTFEGPAAGKGSVYSWVGNHQVGEGKMTVTDSKAPDDIHIQLDFLKPMKDTCQSEFTFKPQDKQTVVTWSMSGHRTFFSKIICVFMNMDKMVGGEFEKGLTALKGVVESAPKK